MTAHKLSLLCLLGLSLLFTGTWNAHARERETNDPIRVRLSADQIDSLTTGFTWIIVNQHTSEVSQTFFRDDGVRFTKRRGQVDQMGWSIRDEGLRCVHIGNTSRCGLIANIDGQLTICMQIQPMGDCAYSITERFSGDAFELERQHRDQN